MKMQKSFVIFCFQTFFSKVFMETIYIINTTFTKLLD